MTIPPMLVTGNQILLKVSLSGRSLVLLTRTYQFGLAFLHLRIPRDAANDLLHGFKALLEGTENTIPDGNWNKVFKKLQAYGVPVVPYDHMSARMNASYLGLCMRTKCLALSVTSKPKPSFL